MLSMRLHVNTSHNGVRLINEDHETGLLTYNTMV